MDCRRFFLRPAAFLPKAASPASFLLLKSAMAAMHHLRGFPACSLTDPVYGDTESAGPSVRRAGISWQGAPRRQEGWQLACPYQGFPPAEGGMRPRTSLPAQPSPRDHLPAVTERIPVIMRSARLRRDFPASALPLRADFRYQPRARS